MTKIKVYKMSETAANIHQTKITRDWMDLTTDKHAYRCYPVSMANTIGWSLSYDEDISFVWDGISDTSADHVTLVKGHKHCSTGRANGTISFETGLIFRTDPEVTMLSIAPPNYFIEGAQAFTSVISTSFFKDTFPCAWKITKSDSVITIPAGTPVATLIPISMSGLAETSLDIYDRTEFLNSNPGYNDSQVEYARAFSSAVASGTWPRYYQNGTDHLGNKLGEHEITHLKMPINNHITGEKTDYGTDK